MYVERRGSWPVDHTLLVFVACNRHKDGRQVDDETVVKGLTKENTQDRNIMPTRDSNL